ncbi:ABC transporter substrate-binding protein [uncultured Castellaniella sp.]|uniref:ABC transporter substrate-binding protein n=1 Tax=uncultured Castellaniella sp. TaxID=647907 RepID=UPI0026303EE7|nr:ABC transporter substrate-binding protein [uncultured Castellaniella sp.]
MKFGLKKSMRRTALCTAIGALSVGLAGNAAAADKPIKIGVVTFLSGAAAGTFGIPARNGAELIADQINAGAVPGPYGTKGFGGTPIELKIIDEAGGSTKAVTEYRNLVGQQDVDMVVGYISSGDCLAVAPVAEELKKLTVFFDCGTPRIFEDNSYHYVFRTGALGTMDNVSAALYLKDRGVKVDNYAGINQNYAYGQDNWADFTATMAQIYPKAKIATAQFPKLGAGQYGAEISTLLSSRPDVVMSSFWGGDTDALILQGSARGLFKKSKVILTAGETAVQKLGSQIPDGTIIGARGPFDMLAPDSAMNTWFRKAFEDRYSIPPSYPAYKITQALLGVKTAYEKAKAANNNSAPSQEQIIAAFEHLTWTGPGGEVTLGLGKGHQAVQGTAVGTVKHENGALKVVDIVRFPADKVTPPDGVKSTDWIKNGFKQ